MVDPDREKLIRDIIYTRSIGLGSQPTERAISQILKWQEDDMCVCHDRPSWDDTYISMARTLAKRSHDTQTQHGCVIVSQDMKPLSWGYNGFLAGIWDDILPNTRPDKYTWMMHAEINAIMNARSSLSGGVAYITGHPCVQCYQFMVASGISEIVYGQTQSACVEGSEDALIQFDIIRWLTYDKICLREYNADEIEINQAL